MRAAIMMLASVVACFSANFTYIQKTPNSSTGALSQAFGSNTTAGNAIIVFVYNSSGGATVSDTQGNTYVAMSAGAGNPQVRSYAAVNIVGGADIITAVGPASGGVLGMEYSSSTSPYYVCPGTDAGSGSINNSAVVSTHEVMVVWGADGNFAGGTWTATTGTVRFSSTMPFGFTTGVAAGDDDIANMPTLGGYTNTIKFNGSNFASQSTPPVFLNLDNPSCLASITAGIRHRIIQ